MKIFSFGLPIHAFLCKFFQISLQTEVHEKNVRLGRSIEIWSKLGPLNFDLTTDSPVQSLSVEATSNASLLWLFWARVLFAEHCLLLLHYIEMNNVLQKLQSHGKELSFSSLVIMMELIIS